MGRWYVGRRVAASIRELRDHPPAEFAATTERIASLTAEVVDAPDVQLCFGIRDGRIDDALCGWRPLLGLRFGPNAEHDAQMLNQWYRSAEHQAIDPSVQALAQTAGRPRAFLTAQVGDEAVWRHSGITALLDESGIGDRLVAGTPLTDRVELLLIAYRRASAPAFSSAECQAVTDFASRLEEPATMTARAHGLIDAHAPLTARERDVLHHLLLGLTESSAAKRLGLTVRSLHQHVVAIHRKLGVRSRGELAAHFLAPHRRRAALIQYAPLLDERELNVLACLMGGLSEKEIADELRFSVRTVHHLVGSIYRKTGTRTHGSLLAQVLLTTTYGGTTILDPDRD